MRKLYLFILTALLTVSLQAQFTMTAKSHGFNIGDTHNFIFAKGINEGQSGPNVIWDFTALEKQDKSLTSNMLDPKTIEKSNLISNSNFVLEEFGNKFFFKTALDGMYQYGAINCNTVTTYDKPFVKLKFPFSYGNKFAGNYSGKINGTNYETAVSGNYEIFADAYGTLLLPGNISVENALRIRQTRTIVYENSSAVTTEITYRWYSQDIRYPVLVIVKYITENSTDIAEVAICSTIGNKEKKALVSTSIDNPEVVGSVEAFPNPFGEELKITYKLEKSEKITIEVYDIEGKLFNTVLQATQDAGDYTYTLSASKAGLKDGIYYIKLHAGNDTFTRKVVKQ